MSRCRSCDAEIFWVTTEAGKSMPLDALPSADGNVMVSRPAGKPVAAVLAGLFLAEARESGRVLYMPHHATCPQGEAWRKR